MRRLIAFIAAFLLVFSVAEVNANACFPDDPGFGQFC